MAAENALHVLRAADPATRLEPLAEEQRLALRDAALASAPRRRRQAVSHRRRTAFRLALAVVAVALLGTGIAWASGALSPQALFEANPQSDGSAPGSLWDQRVIAGSVRRVASVDLPTVGPVAFWYGRTKQGGWCAGLRLQGGQWLGTGKSPLDGGGTVPGCFPTREMVNGASDKPVYVINGFDYVESDADARAADGEFWRIYYGRVVAGAVRVTDLVSGVNAQVVGNLFLLAVRDPDPSVNRNLHLVAYDRAGKVVADACELCSGR